MVLRNNMKEPSNSKKILRNFLEVAKSYNNDVEPRRVLLANAFQIGKANVLIRVASDLGKRYFFGLNYIHAEEISNLSNSFVAFVCGNLQQVVFMPTSILVKHLSNISQKKDGGYRINFSRDLNLVLTGRGRQFNCSEFINNWNLLQNSSFISSNVIDPTESIHTVVQGRLLEIGNIRGYDTYCPNKSKRFNKIRLDEISSLQTCPSLQYSEFNSLRNIDVIWFRKAIDNYYPECAFEVEFSTGIWSGWGRLATLREYNTKLYIISPDRKKFNQVRKSFPDLKSRYINLIPDQVGLLYSAEKNLIEMCKNYNL